jgi:hypothetical protein
MGTNHGDFSGNAADFSAVRLNEAAGVMGHTDQFTHTMNRTMSDIMPKWPSTVESPAGKPPPLPPGAQVQFSIVVNGQLHGPYGMDALAQMAADGQLNAQNQVWRQGMAGWQAAGTVPELAPLFAGAAGAPPAP